MSLKEKYFAQFLNIPISECRFSINEPYGIQKLVHDFNEKNNVTSLSLEKTLVENWTLILGQYSDRCYPVKIEKMNLYISIPNTTLKNELMFVKSSILLKINKLEYCGGIRRIILI